MSTAFTNNSFPNGITINGIPIILTSPNIRYVRNYGVSASGDGVSFGKTPEKPYNTIDYAISQCEPNKGFVIVVLPGHTETVSTASGITVDVAGISIVGIGEGNDRPQITFSTIIDATMVVSAQSVVIQNIIGIAGIDNLTNPIVVTGDNCSIDIEWRDASATVETATAIRLDTANNAKVKLNYLGFTGGNALVHAIAIDNCDNVQIDINAYGICSTAWVNMVDVASTNVQVKGTFYTQGIVNASRNVVDTITGSTWSVQGYDASAGGYFSGGSANAVTLGGVIGDKRDEAVYTPSNTASLTAYIKAILSNTYQKTSKSTGTLVGAGQNVTLFIVTGVVQIRKLFCVIDTSFSSTSGTTTAGVGVSGSTGVIIAATNLTSLVANRVWVDSTPVASAEPIPDNNIFVANGADIIIGFSVNDITAGALTIYCEWQPISAGATLVAA